METGMETGAVDLVRAYLEAMERRDLDTARGYLAEGFRMVFPGNAVFHRPEELVEWAKHRYRRIGKIYERFDEAEADDGTIVYCYGSLAGEWPDGSAFAGIRFIDRFTVVDGLIGDQMVWNDLAEARPEAGS